MSVCLYIYPVCFSAIEQFQRARSELEFRVQNVQPQGQQLPSHDTTGVTHTTAALPTRLEHKSLVGGGGGGGGGGGELHTTTLPTRLENKSPVREGDNRPAYNTGTQVAGQRRGRGDIHTTTLPTRLKHKSPVRGWRTTQNHTTYKTRTQVTDEGGRRR